MFILSRYKCIIKSETGITGQGCAKFPFQLEKRILHIPGLKAINRLNKNIIECKFRYFYFIWSKNILGRSWIKKE